MWIAMILAAMTSVMVLVSGNAEYLDRERPVADRQAMVEIANFRMFAWSAWAYVKANPTASGSIYWATIKTSSAIPDGLKNANINSTWKINADGAGNYTVCASMSERAIAQLNKAVPDTVPRNISTSGRVVLAASAQVETESSKCN